MTVQVFNPFVASLALVSAALAVAVVAVPSVRRRISPYSTPLALAVAATATGGSLVYSQYFMFEPCLLCWYQRIAMYPLVPILAIAWWRKDVNVRWYVLPLAIVGLGISIWHYLVQTFPALSDSVSCGLGVPCGAKYVNEFQALANGQFAFISIPFMAGCGFLLIIALMTLSTPKELT
jgi:disulfide bond formation protein DsbB